jgi:hypothetical protein
VNPADFNDPPPSCRGLRFDLDPQTFALCVTAEDGVRPSWTAPLPVPADYLRQLNNAWGGQGNQLLPTYRASDHFLLISLGPLIVGVDRIERRARWVRSVLPADLPQGTQVLPGGPDGVMVQTAGGNGNGRRLGVLGPVGPDGVLLTTMTGVAMLDVSTGEVRWIRADSAVQLDAFGDADHIYLAEMHASGDVRAVRSLRPADGAAETIPDAAEAYTQRVRLFGGRILASAPGAQAGLHIRYYDLQTGKDLWEKTFPEHSVLLESNDPELAAVAAPDGAVTVVDLSSSRDGQPPTELQLHADKKDVEGLVRGMLLRDRTHYYVALQVPPGGGAVVQGDPGVNFTGPVRSTEVNGVIYAFDRSTHAVAWKSVPVEAQQLLLDHFEESPVLLMTAQQQRQLPGAAPGQITPVAVTCSIDKKTGLMRFRKEVTANIDPYFALEINVRTGTVDLVNNTTRLRHYIEPAKDGGGKKD